MELNDLQGTIKELEALGSFDDCMWMNTNSFGNLKELMCIRVQIEPHCVFAGMHIFVDDSVLDHTVESGTYKIEDGCLRKIVNRRFSI